MKKKEVGLFFSGMLFGCFWLTTLSKINVYTASGDIRILFTYPKSERAFDFVEIEPELIKEINKAKKTIHICSYSWNSIPIANAVMKAIDRGVEVYLTVDKQYEYVFFDSMKPLCAKGIHLKIRRIHGISHSKFIVIDDNVVCTGSYNFGSNANNKNDENVVIITNQKIAKAYIQNWRDRAKNAYNLGDKINLSKDCSNKTDIVYESKDLVYELHDFNVTYTIKQLIKNAEKLDIMFNSPPSIEIINTIKELQSKGLLVRVLSHPSCAMPLKSFNPRVSTKVKYFKMDNGQNAVEIKGGLLKTVAKIDFDKIWDKYSSEY